MNFSPDEIAKLKRKNMSLDEFVAHAARFGVKISRSKMAKLDNGEFLGVWQKENGEYVRIHLQTIFFKRFYLQWQVTNSKGKKGRIGKELLISNIRLPRGTIKR